jgi:hypothetical protein
MVVMMQFLRLEGPFCRRCGLATFRRMTSATMWQGWWGYGSFVITPITVLINLVRRGKVASLPEPQPYPYGQNGTPADPGPALLARPGTLVGLIIPVALFAVLLFAIVAASTSP